MKKIIILISIFTMILCTCSQSKEQRKSNIVIYGDYKCPYCKQLESKVMHKLKKEYINKGKVKVDFVNVASLGDDSIKGSRAGHAVQNIAPNKYLEFQKLMFSQQPNHENEWITEKLIDKQINKLNLSKSKTQKIKKAYKTKNNKSWKDAEKDRKQAKKDKIKEVPTVYIDGKKLENPYSYNEYKKKLKSLGHKSQAHFMYFFFYL